MFKIDSVSFSSDANWRLFDYEKPEAIDESLRHSFDCVVIDPPFISAAVWQQYADAANLLLGVAPSPRFIIGTTIPENAKALHDMFGVRPVTFKPEIPNLVYQYELFTNFQHDLLDKHNPNVQYGEL